MTDVSMYVETMAAKRLYDDPSHSMDGQVRLQSLRQGRLVRLKAQRADLGYAWLCGIYS